MKVAPHMTKKLVSFLKGTGHPLQHPEVVCVRDTVLIQVGRQDGCAWERSGQNVTSEQCCGMQQQRVAFYLLTTVLCASFDTCPTFIVIQWMPCVHHCDVQ